MLSSPRIKGWCPGAWRPMATGDGLLVRVRPPMGELSRAQLLALCDAAETFGSGLIELTRRANIQLRGVSHASWPPLMDFLLRHQLVSADPETERQPPLMLAPDWQAGEDSPTMARLLQARGAEVAALPGKVGIAIDAGDAPVLGEEAADFRIERSECGGLLVRADGHPAGTAVEDVDTAVALLIRLTHWFMESGGGQSGRMRRHMAPLPAWAPEDTLPAPAGPRLALGRHPAGWVVGLPLGRTTAATLREWIAPATVTAGRVTPWRRLLLKGAFEAANDGLILDDADPRLSLDACPGAPYCEQASVETQRLAERLSGVNSSSVHISGCAKGCARRAAADLCLVGQSGRFHLIVNGSADSTPVKSDLTESEVIAYLESLGALSV
ncbi:cobalamin biosynthesis protein CobG [Halomonas sp. 141]|uniref:cobalamin biosynthesis protein CobG n=1 Tax=Halomonadaceae TaxID=28256 RepID=UPI00030FA99A|nr:MULTISPECIES: cobalamin biosynthesis protein CobG [Halomonas]PJX13983.1 cobalamin biosynthesis protein CobG [Halomonas sp. 141]